MKIKNEQLELIQKRGCKSLTRPSRLSRHSLTKAGRRQRASLWFQHMRQIVDSATDWQPVITVQHLNTEH